MMILLCKSKPCLSAELLLGGGALKGSVNKGSVSSTRLKLCASTSFNERYRSSSFLVKSSVRALRPKIHCVINATIRAVVAVRMAVKVAIAPWGATDSQLSSDCINSILHRFRAKKAQIYSWGRKGKKSYAALKEHRASNL